MRTLVVLLALLAFAPVASALPVPYVIVYGPHPDGEGTGNSCSDVQVDRDQIGVCAGPYAACPVYYDTYRFGVSGCLVS